MNFPLVRRCTGMLLSSKTTIAILPEKGMPTFPKNGNFSAKHR
jgi:hypothetical protein